MSYCDCLPERGHYEWCNSQKQSPDALALLRRVAASGVEYDEPRIDYVVIQMDRDLWTAIQARAKEGKNDAT